jgi:hypothetical protein
MRLPGMSLPGLCYAMAKRSKSARVAFIADYEDGSKGYFDIDVATLRSPGHIAIVVALEKQRAGHLKPGKIIRARRDLETYLSQR